MATTNIEIGAVLKADDQCQFTLWGPELNSVEVKLVSPQDRSFPMTRIEQGFWTVSVDNVSEGTQYFYCINQTETRPDPASRYQPEGVHGPSVVVDHRTYDWQDSSWQNLPLQDYVIYELHVGTFTPEGTFEAAIARLPYLKELGITAIEIMPVAQFPGARNWGYDGVFPYAVQNSYGGPAGLKQLVEACHQHEIAVILDVVYNHFGPEGNYTGFYGPYITQKYSTPWGGAINFDDTWCDGVRQYFVENVLYWLRHFHIDGLRLDAVHAIYDFGAKHFLADMAEAVDALSDELGKPHYLIAESDLNDTRLLRPPTQGGYGLDAQWSDDFHHALHALLTHESEGYYQDFDSCEALATAIRDRFVYSGQFSRFRRRRHGNSATDLPSTQFVVCAQNHDQIGNHITGKRFTQKLSFEALKLAAGAVITSPYLPLLFMGEEYGDPSPFLYFIDHGDPDLIQAVAEGRKKEFEEFHAVGEPIPAHEEATFEQVKLKWELQQEGQHNVLWRYYQQLLQLRKQLGLNAPSFSKDIRANSDEEKRLVYYQRDMADGQLLVLMNFNDGVTTVEVAPPQQDWYLKIDSAAEVWQGPGSSLPEKIMETQVLELAPLSLALYWIA
ncbi:malto-oligosyltrehalose trehalohydrolase [Oscillatoria sp. CS-180]|uniref:malto-oligosyltrehalose trehalohydrolase n=1 Tax=Oscillatoria sp. CS-180 TaxID=3021720 RepID=UPI00232C6476|nr:malto-oligosyltrehalose trehalohydrolase [Oscillatoria sp. CS-180]MDB9527826.1 malto-oligosyltrehalose trehalohydrolase [Oscillatoria sp. CS-180]